MVVLSELGLTETAASTVVPGGAVGVAIAVAAAPIWEKQVLGLALAWPGLDADATWAADRLRVNLLTWDPFEWQPGRPAAFATTTRRGDGPGLVLYLPHWQALVLAGGQLDALPAVLGQLAESVLSVAGDYQGAIVDGSFAGGVQSGVLPRFLDRIPDQPVRPTPTLSLTSEGWQPIQFDALEDLGQDCFGPADLDRSPIRFAAVGEGRSGCPGCAGQAIDFPDGLKDAQEAICGVHRVEALQLTTARLEASKASNPAGWEALLDAGQRLLEPHLPNGLGPRLVAAAELRDPTAAELVAQADLVVGAAALMAGLPDVQTGLGGRLTPVRSWLERLPTDLAAHGLADESAQAAVAVGELLLNPSAEVLEAAAAAAASEAIPEKPKPFVREVRIGRNAACPCGSGKKYKFCHGTER